MVIGVDDKGKKRLLALEDGVRESKQSWYEVLSDLKFRGLDTFKLALGDGALGFWNAVEELYPEFEKQRCWVHKTGNVLNKMPKSIHAKAKSDLQQIWMSETEQKGLKAYDHWINKYSDKYPKAAECLLKDKDSLLTFYKFPAVHWQHIRTTNPIESTFATVPYRTKRCKGCMSRNGMMSMMFKVGIYAEDNWRRLRGYEILGKVITGVKFKDGIEEKNKIMEAA